MNEQIKGAALEALYAAYEEAGAEFETGGNLTCHALNVREGEAMFDEIALDIALASCREDALERAEQWGGLPVVVTALGHQTPYLVLEECIRRQFA